MVHGKIAIAIHATYVYGNACKQEMQTILDDPSYDLTIGVSVLDYRGKIDALYIKPRVIICSPSYIPAIHGDPDTREYSKITGKDMDRLLSNFSSLYITLVGGEISEQSGCLVAAYQDIIHWFYTASKARSIDMLTIHVPYKATFNNFAKKLKYRDPYVAAYLPGRFSHKKIFSARFDSRQAILHFKK